MPYTSYLCRNHCDNWQDHSNPSCIETSVQQQLRQVFYSETYLPSTLQVIFREVDKQKTILSESKVKPLNCMEQQLLKNPFDLLWSFHFAAILWK